MQPVPVQRSSRRSSGGSFCALRSRPARWVTDAAVSCLVIPSASAHIVVVAMHAPWNEHARPASDLEIAEVFSPEDVLQRLPGGSFCDQLVQQGAFG
jgi:hypothetical protein